MTTIYPFAPNANVAPQFSPILDGVTYTAIIGWNVAGRRYYLNLYSLSGVLIICTPVVGSPLGYDITLTPGMFKSTLVFRAPAQQFETNP